MKLIYKIFVILVILLFSPLMLLISIVIILTSGFPVIFTQTRIGRHGRVFTMYKFRTMINNAHEMQKHLANQNEANGPVFKIRDDPRFTRVGKFLSHTGLDELPQLFNVLLGTMALIGPRPLPVEEEKKLSSWQKKREEILPGIISPWIVKGYHQQSFDAWMKSDIAYTKKKSFWFDLVLLGKFLQFWIFLVAREIKRRI